MRHTEKQEREGQDGRGVGGCGEHLSPRIHQEYTFRHRSACRTPAESGQEYLTREKNMENQAKRGVMNYSIGTMSSVWCYLHCCWALQWVVSVNRDAPLLRI